MKNKNQKLEDLKSKKVDLIEKLVQRNLKGGASETTGCPPPVGSSKGS